MLTATSLKHPAMRARIIAAMLEAASLIGIRHSAKAYVANAKGNNVLRIDATRFYGDSVAVHFLAYGPESRRFDVQLREALDPATYAWVDRLAARIAAPAHSERFWR